MARITDPAVLALAAPDETPWESTDETLVIMQRECPACDKGLAYAPARFCGACGGTGFLARTVKRSVREAARDVNGEGDE